MVRVCGVLRGGVAGEEFKLGLATGFESGVLVCTGVVPQEDLLGGGLSVASVEVGQEGGAEEAAGAEVKDKVDQRVKLTLGERDLDEAGDGLLGVANIRDEDFGGLFFTNSVWKGLRVEEPVAVADGGQAVYVEVDAISEAFRGFEERKTF